MILRVFFWPWCFGALIMLCAVFPAFAQTITFYTLEASYDAAIPAGSFSTVEDFASVTTEYAVAESPAEDSWNGFSANRVGIHFFYNDARYCPTFNGCGDGGWGQANPPNIRGIRAPISYDGFGNGEFFFKPSNPAFAFGMNHWAWSDGSTRMEIALSNGQLRYLNSISTSDIGFIGFKLDDNSIAAGISITQVRLLNLNNGNDVVAVWNIKTSSPPPADPMIVTSTADTNTVGTLRYAMNWANANAGDDNITFDIPGTGPHIITIGSALPVISDDGVSINGLSQPGASCGELSSGIPHQLQISIQSNGSPAIDAFDITHDFASITGLAVGNFRRRGFHLRGSADSATIECNYWGVGPDGAISQPLSTNILTEANQVRGGNRSIIRNNLFSGNNDDTDDIGLVISDGADDVTIVGNIFGLNPVGDTALPNSGGGILIDGSSNVTIGGTSLANQNIISGNGGNGITLNNVSNATILGNYVGVGVDGLLPIANGMDGIHISNNSSNIVIGGSGIGSGNVTSGNVDDGIDIPSGNSVSIIGNFVGTDPTGTIAIGNSDEGIVIRNSVTSVSVGDGTIEGRNIIAGNNSANILVRDSAASIIDTNLIGVGTGGEVLGGGLGIQYVGAGASRASNNLISNNSGDGVFVSTTSIVALTMNSIFNNGGLGINLNGGTEDANGVTDNDSGDGDAGPNNLLNYPVFNEIAANGTQTVTYDFDLDTETNSNGYRIEFYKSSSADPSSHGEGETYLGFVDIPSYTAGSDLNFTGTFTALETVSVGEIVSATTTRKTLSSFDMTSEFSLSATTSSSNPASLTITKTVSPLNAGDYDLPGSDVIYTFTVTNQGDGAVDTDSIILIDSLPPEIIFYNGDHDGPGPSTDVVGFEETSTSLTFDPNTDALFSNGTSRPAGLSECNYVPSAGYDPNVKYVCFNPKGAMLGGNPNPTFNIRFRAAIK